MPLEVGEHDSEILFSGLGMEKFWKERPIPTSFS